MTMLIALDTHAVVWWTLEPARLGRAAAREIGRAERIGVPAISFWEVAVLVRKGRLELDVSVGDWADRVLAIPKVECLAIDDRIALRSEQLSMHADPADRFIVATAVERRARLVTKDAALRRLKFVETVW